MKTSNRTNKKKRRLDLECLSAHRYGVIASIERKLPIHPLMPETAIQHIRQAVADLKRVRPEVADSEVILEFPHLEILRAKLVVSAMQQGALDLAAEASASPTGRSALGSDGKPLDRGAIQQVDNQEPAKGRTSKAIRSIDETSLAEAEQLAATAARVSMAAVDIGTKVVNQAESEPVTLEAAARDLANSPDERVSRKTYGRAVGPEQSVRYAQLGERMLGGGHCIPRDLQSADSFRLSKCKVATGRDGALIVEGSSDDPEWLRLNKEYPACTSIIRDADISTTCMLRSALALDRPVDMDVCVSERIRNKRRTLNPLAIHNKPELISGLRGMLEQLEDECS